MFAQRGTSGELRAGPILAARFGRWRLERPDDVLGSTVAWIDVDETTIVDSFWFGHDALDLWLDCGKAWWVWRKVTEQEGRWRTRGGPPEIRIK